MIVVANKIDIPGAEEHLQRLKDVLEEDQEIFAVSAATGEGLQALIYRIVQRLPDIPVPEIAAYSTDHLVTKAQPEKRFEILKADNHYTISGKEIEKHVRMTLFDREESVYRFQNILKAMGVDDALREAGIKEGDSVEIAGVTFEWE